MRRVFLAFAALMLLADVPEASGQSVDFSSRELSLGGELQQAINSKRLQLGQPELQSLTNELEEAQLIYSDAVLGELLRGNACDHDRRDFTALQQLIATSPKPIDVATPTSEVIGCPSPTRGWSPPLEVGLWRQSPHHNHILFEEQDHRYIGCAVKQVSGRTAALCTLWSPNS